MGNNSKTNQITIETVDMAIKTFNIINNRELYAEYYKRYNGELQKYIHKDAIQAIRDNPAGFEKLLWDRLATLPLIQKFFGRLIEARVKQRDFLASYIARAIFDKEERLEHRVKNTHDTPAFQTIFQEIGNIKDPIELDQRLLDAWAEILMIDQLVHEKFTDIRKVRTPADLVAKYMEQPYAIQVTRIRREPHFPDLPMGNFQKIYDEVSDPIGKYFWDSLDWKNSKFRDVSPLEYVRRITIMTSTPRLLDQVNRHVFCLQIRDSILDFENRHCRHFDEIQWLLGNGHGAIFRMETSDEEVKVRCWADWVDDPADHPIGSYDDCHRREVDLDSKMPAYK